MRLLFSMLSMVSALFLSGVGSAEQANAPGVATGEYPEYVVEDRAAAEVTAENLMQNERFWPYHVRILKPWLAEGLERPLRAGKIGVLIRVVDSETVRLDFGGFGQYDLPLEMTNLLEEANAIRLGERYKMGPNFVLALGPRLVQPVEGHPRPYQFSDAAAHRAFLCVFADPTAEGFDALVADLARLAEREGLLTILLPQGEHTDFEVNDRLVAAGWTVPYVFAHLTHGYTVSLVGKDPRRPLVTLQTAEGRLLFERRWSASATPELMAAVDRALGGASVAAGTDARDTPTP